MASAPKIPTLFPPPDQESLRTAIARCIQNLQREHGVTLPELAHAAECTPETMRLAWKRETTLGTELFARLQFWFRETPHCFLPYLQLINPESACQFMPPSEDERFDQIERHLNVLRDAANERRREAA